MKLRGATKMQKTGKNITPETPVNLLILSGCIVALFSLYQVFSPKLEMIRVNATTIERNHRILKQLEENQREYNQSILEISKALSRIEGKMEHGNR